ncbi:MAG: curli assembly protein CsgF [Pseudomonadota bacterium]
MTRLAVTLIALFGTAAPLAAGDLIYRPVNPAFGGPANNFDYLVGTAQIQNQHRPEQSSGGGGGGGVPNISFPDISIDLGGALGSATPPTTTPATSSGSGS